MLFTCLDSFPTLFEINLENLNMNSLNYNFNCDGIFFPKPIQSIIYFCGIIFFSMIWSFIVVSVVVASCIFEIKLRVFYMINGSIAQFVIQIKNNHEFVALECVKWSMDPFF